MTNEHDTPGDNKPIATDWDAETINLTRRESLRLAELLEDPPPRYEAFLHAQARYRSLMSDAEPVLRTSKRIGIAKGLLAVCARHLRRHTISHRVAGVSISSF